jgi:RimJ/RimL family protein N-acetyltransferase
VAAVIRNLAYSTDELTAFGADPDAVWDLLRVLDGWTCVNVAPAIAPTLAGRIAAATGSPPRLLTDIYNVAAQPVPRFPHPAVRLLTPADAPLLLCAAPAVRGAGWRSIAELLTEGVAAAAVIEGEIRALAHTSARAGGYIDIGVATLPAWRGQGLATAAAALVAEQVQAAGQVPVWSTAEDNVASLRVARKLRFREVARRVYVIRADTGAVA